jgi:hypothetical protein
MRQKAACTTRSQRAPLKGKASLACADAFEEPVAVPSVTAMFMHMAGVIEIISGIVLSRLDKDRQLYCYGLVDCERQT